MPAYKINENTGEKTEVGVSMPVPEDIVQPQMQPQMQQEQPITFPQGAADYHQAEARKNAGAAKPQVKDPNSYAAGYAEGYEAGLADGKAEAGANAKTSEPKGTTVWKVITCNGDDKENCKTALVGANTIAGALDKTNKRMPGMTVLSITMLDEIL